MENGFHTRSEILSQPAAWSAALTSLAENHREISILKPANRYNQIIYTGCGSTHYLAMAAASLTQELTSLQARAFPASELWLSPRNCYVDGKTLLIAISRSGETTETLRACETFLKDKKGDLLTFSCYEDMPLAKMGIVNIILPSGQEKSVAQTRAFSTLYIGTLVTILLWAGRNDLLDSLSGLPEIGAKLLSNYGSLATSLGHDDSIDRFYILGSGSRYGLACELSLKMKEMSLSHSEPFYFMEFRHGPKSMITPASLVIGLCSTANSKQESAVLEDVKALGGTVVKLAESDSDINFNSNLDEAVRNVLFLPIGQMIAFERALFNGLDPDRPKNLDNVVKLI